MAKILVDPVMEKKGLVIWGASGHARVVADIVTLENKYHLKGFIDDVNPEPRQFLGLPVYGGRDVLGELKGLGVEHVIMGFGNCKARMELAAFLREQGFSLATAVHPHAVVAAGVPVGVGTVVAAGAIINPGAVVGENVIINTKASVDHDCEIADGAHICPGVTLGGSVTIGTAAWIGIGTTVKEKISIGSYSILGAGSVVVRDIPDGAMAYGIPARVRSNQR